MAFKWLFSISYNQPISLKHLAKRLRIPYRFMKSSNDEGLESWIKLHNPDVIVVFSMSQLLKPNIFSILKNGAINLHPSFLPEFRGPNPDFWYYYHMEMNPGVTVHFVDTGEDTGDIPAQKRIQISLGMKSPQRLDLMIGKVGVELLLEVLEKLECGNVDRKKQAKISPTKRARNIRKEEHKSIIDWQNWSIERIWHVMRGTELWLDCINPPKGVLLVKDGLLKRSKKTN